MPGDNMPYVTKGPKTNILPNFDTPEVLGGMKGPVIANLDDLTEVGTILSTATRGIGSLTVATAGAAGDTALITIAGLFSALFTSPGGTTTAIATALAAFINRNFPMVVATSAAAVVSLTSKYPGAAANFSVASAETGTIDLTPVALTGGAGEIITPLEPITVQVGKNTIYLAPGRTIRTYKPIRDAIVASGRYYS